MDQATRFHFDHKITDSLQTILHGNAISLTDTFVFYWDYLPLHHSWSDLVHCAHMFKKG